jgi:hypothetical protein
MQKGFSRLATEIGKLDERVEKLDERVERGFAAVAEDIGDIKQTWRRRNNFSRFRHR